MTDIDTAAIEARLAADTAPTWHVCDDDATQVRDVFGRLVASAEGVDEADLIAHAPGDLRALLDERERLEGEARQFARRLGFGDGVTEPAASLDQMVDPIATAFSAAEDHAECPVLCELCGEPLAKTICAECHGSGCLPNSALAYLECGSCAGSGRVHEGCVEASYDELRAARDAALATIAAVAALAEEWSTATCQTDGAPCSWHRVSAECAAELLAALDGER